MRFGNHYDHRYRVPYDNRLTPSTKIALRQFITSGKNAVVIIELAIDSYFAHPYSFQECGDTENMIWINRITCVTHEELQYIKTG